MVWVFSHKKGKKKPILGFIFPTKKKKKKVNSGFDFDLGLKIRAGFGLFWVGLVANCWLTSG